MDGNGSGNGSSNGWVVIGPDECESLLRQSHLGRIAVVDDDEPLILPVNFVLDNNAVVFRTAPGSKLDAAIQASAVAFEIDGIDPQSKTGWSVVIRGRAHEVTDTAELDRLEKLTLVPWAPGDRRHYVRVTPSATTGRRITVPSLPEDYWG